MPGRRALRNTARRHDSGDERSPRVLAFRPSSAWMAFEAARQSVARSAPARPRWARAAVARAACASWRGRMLLPEGAEGLHALMHRRELRRSVDPARHLAPQAAQGRARYATGEVVDDPLRYAAARIDEDQRDHFHMAGPLRHLKRARVNLRSH